MATKSILKDIRITEKKLARKFVDALEYAEGKHSKEVKLSRTCKDIGKDKIKAFFGDN